MISRSRIPSLKRERERERIERDSGLELLAGFSLL